ncbi:MAG: hypothetical protein ACPH7H_00010, partial [Porticoccaceae bacterium]
MCHLISSLKTILSSCAVRLGSIAKVISALVILASLSVAANANQASFSEAFGGTTISEDGTTFTFPAAADGWGGFANMNTDLYPLRFTEDGSIT